MKIAGQEGSGVVQEMDTGRLDPQQGRELRAQFHAIK